MEKNAGLWELAFPSTELEDVTFSEGKNGSATLLLTHFAERHRCELGLRFEQVRAYRHRAESHCTVWHIDAYDTLVEVEDSEWVAELLEAMPEDMRDLFEVHHYLIYLDSAGSYEIVAKSWAPLPEKRV